MTNFRFPILSGLILIIGITSSACTTQTTKGSVSEEPQEKTALPTTDYNLDQYFDEEITAEISYIAETMDTTTREAYIQDMARALFQSKQSEREESSPSTKEETRDQETLIRLIAAKLALRSNLPSLAINLLPHADSSKPSLILISQKIRTDASIQLGLYVDSIRSMIKEYYLVAESGIKEEINTRIWSTLSLIPNVGLRKTNTDDPVLGGWIDLAQIFRKAQIADTAIKDDIIDWKTRNLFHPANINYVDLILDDFLNDYRQFNNIALLLPTTGDYHGAANVIAAGLYSSYYSGNSNHKKPIIRFYDTGNKNVTTKKLVEQAIDDGADIIIGPIDKQRVEEILLLETKDIPVLTLNYSENSETGSGSFYQFGLLPEDEADFVAELASQKNMKHISILAPDSDWGDRLSSAFSNRSGKLGGKIISQQRYATDIDDFSKPIKALLNIDQSNVRYNKVKRVLRENVKFIPRRRQDVDAIFVAATYREARGILPALRFHHAAEVQALSTSHVYTGYNDRSSDRDLNGLLFCEIPWLISSRNDLRDIFIESYGEKNRYSRLFALGVDAYTLINNLSYLKNKTYASYPGETGTLFLDESNRIHRKLVWAKFIGGRPLYIRPANIPSLIREDADNES